MDDVFSASVFLSDILTRYANIEANYRDQKIRDVEHLEDHLVGVFKAVLEYSAKVRENHTLSVGCTCSAVFLFLLALHLRFFG